MPGGRDRVGSTAGLFAVYAVASLALVVVLGVVLSSNYRAEAERRGVATGLSQARLVAATAVSPVLDGRPLADGLGAQERVDLERIARRALESGDLLRLRLRDTEGKVVFTPDGSGLGDAVEDEALDAAAGEPVALLTRVNADAVDSGEVGVEAVEVYLPLSAGDPARVVGVLETYLPYAPIQADVEAGMSSLYQSLALGLLLLYVGLFLLVTTMSRRLRRQVRVNRHLAEHDPLTDLPNRAAFVERVRRTLADDSCAPVVVAIVDLDRFKEVNDTLGHDSGDDLLTEMAQRLRAHVRGDDAVARLGGDEFGIVLSRATDAEPALWRVRQILEEETVLRDLPLSIASTIGYAVAGEDADDAEQLMQRADVALYVAKAGRGGVVRYSSAQDHYDPTRLALVAELRRAIENDELVLHYQPKVSLDDASVDSLEALVRWRHPSLGMLGPDRFVPLVEQTDLIDDLTAWVLDRALADVASLGSRSIPVAVNVSARSVSSPELVTRVATALSRHDVAPAALVVEITETALLLDPARAAAVLVELSRLGVGISIDDFGAGQTSLGHLASLPLHEIKVDRGFVRDVDENATNAAIARSIIDLGHSLGVRVVAEGVETEEVAEVLRGFGCQHAQGWLYAKAMPLDDLRAWLARTPVRATSA